MSLTPDILLRAYAMGIFPMAPSRASDEIRWLDPWRRAIFPLSGFHVSRSLARHIRRHPPEVTINTAFAEVVNACADRAETWINAEIFDAYAALHARGQAHSLEVWESGELVGGVYGVTLGAAFFGESMFSRRTDASKVALAFLVHRLRAGGFTLFDVQFLTDHLQSLGAVEVPRAAYQRQLQAALGRTASFAPEGYAPDAEVVLQLFGRSQVSTQTS
jgi:leucyl/phenylalanyl-tRNA--protein transferase